MHYFKCSGVLAIMTMQCIPMLILYDTLHCKVKVLISRNHVAIVTDGDFSKLTL
jgi:hypothetical protein